MRQQQGAALTEAGRRFEAWRRGRARGARIPEDLWRVAARAAREQGVSKVAQKLRVDYYALKRQAEGAPTAPAEGERVEFLELPRQILSAGPVCVVEIQDPRGVRLRVELGDATQAGAVAQALWSRRR